MTPSTNDHESHTSESATSESADFATAKKVEPGTGARIVRITAVIVIALAVGFFFVHRSKNDAEARLAVVDRGPGADWRLAAAAVFGEKRSLGGDCRERHRTV